MKTKYFIIIFVFIVLSIVIYKYKDKIFAFYLKSGGTLPKGTTLYQTPSFSEIEKNDPILSKSDDSGLTDSQLMGKYGLDHIPSDAEANKDDINAYTAIYNFNTLNETT